MKKIQTRRVKSRKLLVLEYLVYHIGRDRHALFVIPHAVSFWSDSKKIYRCDVTDTSKRARRDEISHHVFVRNLV